MEEPSSQPDLAALERRVATLEARLTRLEGAAPRWASFFRPGVGLALACLAPAVFALGCAFLFQGEQLYFYLYYFSPIAAPFVAFLFERARGHLYEAAIRAPALLVDGVVLTLSLIRSFYAIPWISGHAFFLTYAVLTARSRWSRALAILVLLQVIYLKAFVWRDPTLLGGAAAGLLAALLWRWLGKGRFTFRTP